MHDAGTVRSRDIVRQGDKEGLALYLNKGQKLFVFKIFQVASFHRLKDFHRTIVFFQNSVHQILRQVVNFIALAHFHIVDIRMHRQGNVGRQGPRCRRPSKKILIARAFHREFHIRCCHFIFTIALCHLMGG